MRYLDIAHECAFAHEKFAQAKICALLVKRGKVISVGYNHKKTHPLQAAFSSNEHAIYLHAEIDAIRRAKMRGKDVKGATLYVARSLSDGTRACAKPCKGCEAAIKAHEIRKVVYT